MNTTSKTTADREFAAHVTRMNKARIELGQHTHLISTINLFFHNYHKIFGTTTECYNILGPIGLLPPPKEYKPCSLLSLASSPTH